MKWLSCPNVRVVFAAIFVVSLSLGLWSAPVEAKELFWDRNSEADMQDYQVFACETAGCVIPDPPLPSTLRATIAQPALGVQPTWTLPTTLTVGTLAVRARDTSSNVSGLSVQVPFDQVAPAVPRNPALR